MWAALDGNTGALGGPRTAKTAHKATQISMRTIPYGSVAVQQYGILIKKLYRKVVAQHTSEQLHSDGSVRLCTQDGSGSILHYRERGLCLTPLVIGAPELVWPVTQPLQHPGPDEVQKASKIQSVQFDPNKWNYATTSVPLQLGSRKTWQACARIRPPDTDQTDPCLKPRARTVALPAV